MQTNVSAISQGRILQTSGSDASTAEPTGLPGAADADVEPSRPTSFGLIRISDDSLFFQGQVDNTQSVGSSHVALMPYICTMPITAL